MKGLVLLGQGEGTGHQAVLTDTSQKLAVAPPSATSHTSIFIGAC